LKFFCSRYPKLMLRVQPNTKVVFADGEYDTDDPSTITALKSCQIRDTDGSSVIKWGTPSTTVEQPTMDYASASKQEMTKIAASRGIIYIGMGRLQLIRKLEDWDAVHPSGIPVTRVATKQAATVRDDDAFLFKMGWRIPKSEVQLPDPEKWPTVGIVIPVYDAPKLIERCLTTLATTNYKGTLAIQLVDNASKDPRTLQLLKESSYPVHRFEQSVGFSEAVNAGIRLAADCHYHILYNQDIAVINPEWLNHLIRWMEAHPECGICGPKLLYENGTVQHAGIDMKNGHCCWHRQLRASATSDAVNDYRKVAAVTGAVLCIRTSLFKEIGYLDESYTFGCEDLAFCLRVAAKAGREVWYVPTSEACHTDHGVRNQNAATRLESKRRSESSGKLFRQTWGPYIDLCATGSVAFILPGFNPCSGGDRVVTGIANYFQNCGINTTVYVKDSNLSADPDLPRFFEIKPLSVLKCADIVVATRFDTVPDASKVEAKRRFYLVQQIEDVMARNCGGTPKRALDSYKDARFELVTIGDHLATRLKAMGRESSVLDVGLYRSLYPYVERKPRDPAQTQVLMYGCEGYKGPDQAEIAVEIRKAVPGVIIHSFHRNRETPKWSDRHFQPQTTREVAAIYAQHDVYVYASESDGFAMTPIEAMACGTPVVLSDFPGKDQYAKFGENCLIAPFRSAKGIATCVSTLTTNQEGRRQLILGGLITADCYDWSCVGGQYARLMLGAAR